MHSFSQYLTLLCGASAVAGSALPYRNLDSSSIIVKRIPDEVTDVIGDVVEDVADGILDAAKKVIISKIPLEQFGHFDAVKLEDAIADPSLIDTVLKAHHHQAEETRDILGVVLRQTLTNSSLTTNITNIINITNSTSAETEFSNTTSTTTTTTETGTCDASNLSTRIEWRDYSDEDRRALVESIACLIKTPSAGDVYAPSTSRYEDFVRTHQVFTSTIHGNGLFLFWHRYFLQAFESALRTDCGFDRPLPWWDETLDNGAFNQSSLFTADYFGSLPAAVNGAGVCITDGAFANLTCNIGPGSQNTAHCLSRAVNETLTVQASDSFVEYCAVRTDFGSFSGCAETGPHAWAHNGIGSIMSEVSASPSDPIFFMHHLFVDWQLASWQEANSTRKEVADNACEDGSDPCTAPVTLDSVINMNGLLPNVTVGDVLDSQGGTLCYTYDRF